MTPDRNVLTVGYRVHMRVITREGNEVPLCHMAGGGIAFTDLTHRVTCARCRAVLLAHVERLLGDTA